MHSSQRFLHLSNCSLVYLFGCRYFTRPNFICISSLFTCTQSEVASWVVILHFPRKVRPVSTVVVLVYENSFKFSQANSHNILTYLYQYFIFISCTFQLGQVMCYSVKQLALDPTPLDYPLTMVIQTNHQHFYAQPIRCT